MSTKERQAAERLLAVLPHLRIAMSMVKIEVPDGKAELAIIGKRPDGTGKIVCSFDCEEFVADVELLAGEGDEA